LFSINYSRRGSAFVVRRRLLCALLFPLSLVLRLYPDFPFVRQPHKRARIARSGSNRRCSPITNSPSFQIRSMRTTSLTSESAIKNADCGMEKRCLPSPAVWLPTSVFQSYDCRVSFGQATGRFFASILSYLLLCVGVLMVAWTARRQGLHDMMAHTLVIKNAV
jgi:RDD family